MSNLTYTEAKRIRESLKSEYAQRYDEVNMIVGDERLANGLTPDHIKQTQEYRKAKAAVDDAFRRVQAINQVICRDFKAERRAEGRL